jgi:hypothetical protein
MTFLISVPCFKNITFIWDCNLAAPAAFENRFGGCVPRFKNGPHSSSEETGAASTRPDNGKNFRHSSNLPPKWMANWFKAAFQLRIGIIQRFEILRNSLDDSPLKNICYLIGIQK